MSTILTKANIKDENQKKIDERTVETNCPAILEDGVTLEFLVNKLGESQVVKDVQEQEKVKFRAQIRTKLTAVDDNNDYKHSVDEIANTDYTEWVSEQQQRKTPEEKAAEILGKLSPDQIKAAMAMAQQK
jgi:hypothetical protein